MNIIYYLKYIIKYYIFFKLLKIRGGLLFPIGMDYNRNKNRYIYFFFMDIIRNNIFNLKK